MIYLVCNKCGVKKSEEDFYKRNGCRNGIDPSCKKCTGLRTKAYRMMNKEVYQKSSAKYRASNKERVSASNKKYKQSHKEEIKTRTREYWRNNRGRANAKNAKRIAKIKIATPEYADTDRIKDIYIMAEKLSKYWWV